MRTVVIVQARYASTRLRGKVLAEIVGKPVLLHVLSRCQMIEAVDEVCCAVSDEPSSDVVANLAERHGFPTIRGPETDVLERYRMAAAAMRADIIMRVTSDCPLIDPEVCNAVISLRALQDADYASNLEPRVWPKGLDCEVFRREALEAAANTATDPAAREHVTPWLRQSRNLRQASLASPNPDWGRLRWTLDYPQDLEFMKEVFDRLPTDDTAWGYRDVMRIIEADPEIAKINSAISES